MITVGYSEYCSLYSSILTNIAPIAPVSCHITYILEEK